VVELGHGGTIEGTVRTGGSRSAEGLLVGASRGDGEVLTTKVAADGTYRFQGVATGAWIVRVIDEVPEGSSTIYLQGDAPIEWNAEVREGGVTRRDLGVGAGATCVVRGRLVTKGERRWFAALAYPDVSRGQTEEKSVDVAADGTFELSTDRTGDYWLQLMTGEFEMRVFVPLRLVAGEVRVEFAIEVGTIELSSPGDRGYVARTGVWEGERGAFALCSVPASVGGAPAVVVSPIGRVTIVRYDEKNESNDPRRWPVVTTVDVTAKGPASITVK
jgi:hypothetical protein